MQRIPAGSVWVVCCCTTSSEKQLSHQKKEEKEEEEGRGFGLVRVVDQCGWRGGRRQVAGLVGKYSKNLFRHHHRLLLL
jgi:hypothetical protein